MSANETLDELRGIPNRTGRDRCGELREALGVVDVVAAQQADAQAGQKSPSRPYLTSLSTGAWRGLALGATLALKPALVCAILA